MRPRPLLEKLGDRQMELLVRLDDGLLDEGINLTQGGSTDEVLSRSGVGTPRIRRTHEQRPLGARVQRLHLGKERDAWNVGQAMVRQHDRNLTSRIAQVAQ